ncbi:M50 family metallopeptidase [Georgenia sp. Z1491]|uniref:M50 family metallopeptidase n=1 Tax=Georgenia sp. Z1491 TaxID=3416707 RepID=UPI003CE964E6
MSFLLGVLVLAVGLVVSIGLHELGHLVPAKRFGVLVPRYFVGFGPTLWSTRRGETEYGLKAIPLGGFVTLAGMFAPARPGRRTHRADGRPTLPQEAREISAEEVPPGQEHRAFHRLPVGKKIVVMMGGPLVNLVLSVVLLAIVVCGIGISSPTTTLDSVQECVAAAPAGTDGDGTDESPTAQPTPGAPDCLPGPGADAGLLPGDEIVSWGGTEVEEWADVQETIAAGGTGATDVVVRRGGEEVTLSVAPEVVQRPAEGGGTQAMPYVGIGPAFAQERLSPTEVPGIAWEQLSGTAEIIARLPVALVDIGRATLGLQERDPGVVGLVGVGRFAGEIASVEAPEYTGVQRFADLLSLLGALNMTLFVFNLVPLLPLDGGHVAGALWEGLRRAVARLRGRPDPGPADTARLLPLTYVVVAFMIVMTVLLIVADIVVPVSLIG